MAALDRLKIRRAADGQRRQGLLWDGQLSIKPDDDLLWRLDANDPDRFSRPDADDPMLEKLIAKHNDLGQFISLKDEYGVSTEAMARRLRELNLVQRSRMAIQTA